jgi:hypothetical protein
MKILHTFSKINKKIKKITYEDKNGFYNIRVHLERDIYEFLFESGTWCCEIVCFYSYLGEPKDLNDNNVIKNLIPDTLLNYSSEVNKTIKEINIQQTDSNYITFAFNNNKNRTLFTIQFHNEHNGYYPHNVHVNLYENGDKEPMKVLTTSI